MDVLTLQEYLAEFCQNNKAELGRLLNRLPQNVTKLFNCPEKWLILVSESEHILVQVRCVREVA